MGTVGLHYAPEGYQACSNDGALPGWSRKDTLQGRCWPQGHTRVPHFLWSRCPRLSNHPQHTEHTCRPLEVARQFDLYSKNHDLDPRRTLVDYAVDPWSDAGLSSVERCLSDILSHGDGDKLL